MKAKDDTSLSLTEAETLLAGFLARLQAIKAESIQLRQQRPTRAEVATSINAWLDRQIAASGATLLDRLASVGFMTDADANTNTAPGVLFAEGCVGYSTQGVTASGLIPFIAPAIRAYLETWIAGIPDSALGDLPRSEINTRLAALDAERQAILQRRSTLQSLVRRIESAGKIPAADAAAMTLGGKLSAPDDERLEQKYFARV